MIWKNRATETAWSRALTWKDCVNAWMIYCRDSARTRPPPAILVQCCWRFRAWRRIEKAPLGQLHSYSHHLPQHFGILRMAQDPHRSRGKRMGLQNDIFAAHAAPATGVALAGLHEINGTFVFRAPGAFHHAAFRFVHLNKTAGGKNRIHGEILRAHVAVCEAAVGELRQVGQ